RRQLQQLLQLLGGFNTVHVLDVEAANSLADIQRERRRLVQVPALVVLPVVDGHGPLPADRRRRAIIPAQAVPRLGGTGHPHRTAPVGEQRLHLELPAVTGFGIATLVFHIAGGIARDRLGARQGRGKLVLLVLGVALVYGVGRVREVLASGLG